MPESNLSQTSLRELVHDAESQLETLSRALDNLKSTVRRLSAQVAMTEGALPSTGSGYGFGSPSPERSAPAPEEKPFDFSAAAAAFSQDLAGDPPAISHQRPPSLPPPPARTESEWYGVSDGGSWPVGPKHADAPAPQPVDLSSSSNEVQSVDNQVSEAAEVVAAPDEPVAAAIASEWDFDRPTPDAAPTATNMDATDEADVAFDAEDQPAASQPSDEPKRSLSSGWPDEGIWSQSFDWPAMRGSAPTGPEGDPGPPKDDFRSMVDQVRAEIEAARASGETVDMDLLGEEESDDEETRRAEVQRMVEEMRMRATVFDEEAYAETDSEVEDSESVAPVLDDDDAKREEARRAVEQMRAEMAGASSVSFAPPSTPAPSLDWSHMKAENSGPPVLVVKDADGRVELANVYDLLSRLECGESAALLNYTPHSVTVGLPIQAPIPVLEALEAAVMAVFGRGASIDTDGARITVQMGTDVKKKRSEDAA